MALTFEDAFFDSEHLYRQTTTLASETKADKQKKAIFILKKKIVATDTLIRKYHGKKELLASTEKLLISSKEESKQICLDYKSALEKCEKIQKDYEDLKARNKELEQKVTTAENCQAAAESLTKQFEALLLDRDMLIDTLKLEGNLNQEKTSTKLYERKLSFMRKERQRIISNLRNISDCLLSKGKLNSKGELFLANYRSSTTTEGSEPEDDNIVSDIEEDVNDKMDNVPIDNKKDKKEIDAKAVSGKDDNDCDSDIDTGKGSSNEDCDSDKCFNSPDYYIADSPVNIEVYNNKLKQIDSSVSPLTTKDTVETATSPLIFENAQNPENISKVCINTATSPINLSQMTSTADKATSPVILTGITSFEKPIDETKQNNFKKPTSVIPGEYETECIEKVSQTNEKECLERNNSKNFEDNENSNDCEIENIFHNMRMNYDIVTPIPPTPSRSVSAKAKSNRKRFDSVSVSKASNVNEDASILKSGNTFNFLLLLLKEVFNMKDYLLKKTPLHTDAMSEKLGNVVSRYVSNLSVDDLLSVDKFPSEDKPADRFDYIISSPSKSSELEVRKEVSISAEHECEKEYNLSTENGVSIDSTENSNQLEIETEYLSTENNSADDIDNMQNNITQVEQETEFNASIDTSTANNSMEESTTNTQISEDEIEKPFKKDKKALRSKKLTRLEKLRMTMKPKSKIKSANLPPPKKLKHILLKKDNCNSVVPDNKAVYEKAVKIMAELKAKQKTNKNGTITADRNKNSNPDTNKVTNDTVNTGELVEKPVSETSIAINENTIEKTKKAIQENKCKPLVQCEKFAILENNTFAPRNPTNTPPCTNNNNLNKKSDCSPIKGRKRGKRSSIEKSETQTTTRVLRSSTLRKSIDSNDMEGKENYKTKENLQSSVTSADKDKSKERQSSVTCNNAVEKQVSKGNISSELVAYDDMDIFTDEPLTKRRKCEDEASNIILNPKESILSTMIAKHGVSKQKMAPKKIPESLLNEIRAKIEDGIAHISELPSDESRPAMDKLVDELQKYRLNDFVRGLTQYLIDPQRKIELFNKITTPPPPGMTKQEQILLYLITRLYKCWPDIVDCILKQIEYTLFKLNQAPDFDVIESMSHFYAVLCRYIKAQSRLRIFMLDAMYCLQFKAIPVIKQCIDVWMHVLPLSHMGIAKSPIVTCMVYLLHYNKSEDKFKRVEDIRTLLNKKYFYQITEYNETKMLEMLKNAIKELKDIPIEKKMLRLALIILAKRHGPQWCQNKLIKNILQSIITKENVPERIKAFCVSMLGPLMKPYPLHMKVHCEIALNQLTDMLDLNPSPDMKEAIFTSLICLSKYNQNRVIQALLMWHPKNVSSEFEKLLKDYVKGKQMKSWKAILSKIALNR